MKVPNIYINIAFKQLHSSILLINFSVSNLNAEDLISYIPNKDKNKYNKDNEAYKNKNKNKKE